MFLQTLLEEVAVRYNLYMPEIFDATKPHSGTSHPSHAKPSHGHAHRSPHTALKPTKEEHLKHAEEASTVLQKEPPASTPFTAFAAKPNGVSFDVQHDDEPVLMLLRQHPIVTVGWIVTSIFLLLVPLSLTVFPFLSWLPRNFQIISLVGWYVLVTGFIFERFLIWFFNVYIITDERVIDVDFYSLVFKHISEAKIENIEDITTQTTGLLQSLLDYGDVRIQTSAEIPQIEFEKVPHPQKVSKFLSEMLIQEEREKIEGRVR